MPLHSLISSLSVCVWGVRLRVWVKTNRALSKNNKSFNKQKENAHVVVLHTIYLFFNDTCSIRFAFVFVNLYETRLYLSMKQNNCSVVSCSVWFDCSLGFGCICVRLGSEEEEEQALCKINKKIFLYVVLNNTFFFNNHCTTILCILFSFFMYKYRDREWVLLKLNRLTANKYFTFSCVEIFRFRTK